MLFGCRGMKGDSLGAISTLWLMGDHAWNRALTPFLPHEGLFPCSPARIPDIPPRHVPVVIR
jgi:hypothetical protein